MDDYGVLSIVPPALSIFLAVYTRNIIVSLATGALVGSIILKGWNPFFGVVSMMEDHIFAEIVNGSNIQVLIVTLSVGGFIQILDKSGGSRAFSTLIIKFISTPAKAQLGAWGAGISIFFTDSGNALIVGPLFKSIFRELRICREKLAYIIDTTASPVSILVPFVGWGVYITSLIDNAYGNVGLTDDSFEVLLSVWPYHFYALLALTSIPMIMATKKDFGPMARAQEAYNKAIDEGTLEEEEEEVAEGQDGIKEAPKLSTILVPLSVMVITMASVIGYFYYINDRFEGSHIRSGIALSYIFAAISCGVLMYLHKKTPFQRSINHFIRGMEKLVFICIVLTLAWALSSICKDLQTGNYLATLLGDRINPNFLPVIVFFLGAIMSFATGSSYGTFAILMIIVVPVAHTLGAPMILTIAAVLSGGLFGDHTSPISDTTVLASMGAGCAHIDHVSTQFAYALVTGSMTMLALIIAGFYQTPYLVLVMMVVQFFVISGIMKIFGHDSNVRSQ